MLLSTKRVPADEGCGAQLVRNLPVDLAAGVLCLLCLLALLATFAAHPRTSVSIPAKATCHSMYRVATRVDFAPMMIADVRQGTADGEDGGKQSGRASMQTGR